MKETFVQQCLDMMKSEDIKSELKKIFAPVIDILILEVTPYIYIILTLVFSIFLMILAILILLIFVLRSKNENYKLI
jgi:heme/copper-type cytochrome/quinol oxidase subunit 2